MQIVVLAGGLGTRLKPLTDEMPKSMIPISGRPFLEYQLDIFTRNGLEDIIVCVGYLGNRIKAHFADGAHFGVRIRYSEERSELLGTAGAVRHAQGLLAPEFFLTYGDSYLPLDYRATTDWFRGQKKLGAMVVYKNCNRYGQSNVTIGGDLIKVYDKGGRTPGMEYINFGVSLLRKEAVELIPPGRPYSQEEWYQDLIQRRQLLAYETQTRFYEIGSLAGLEEFQQLVTSGALP